jgi:hypothetical protein
MAITGFGALETMIRDGKVRGVDEVCWQGEWQRVERVPELARHLPTDPWAAWSDTDEVSADAIVREVTTRESDAEELPAAAVVPVGTAVVVDTRPHEPPPAPKPMELRVRPAGPPAPMRVEAIPAAPPPRMDIRVVTPRDRAGERPAAPLVAPPPTPLPRAEAPAPPPPAPAPPEVPPPVVTVSVARPPPEEESGKVIAFPRQPVPLPFQLPERPPRSAPAPMVRWSRVGALVIAAGMAALLWYSWMQVAGRPPPAVSAPTPKTVASPGTGFRGPGTVAPDPLADVEKQIRGVDLGEPETVSAPGELGDAMLVELRRLGMDVEDVQADVGRWGGRDHDVPQEAKVLVRLRSSGAVERELGAVALVAGRYKRKYNLDMPVLDVALRDRSGELSKLALDPARAEQFAQGRIDLGAMLVVGNE